MLPMLWFWMTDGEPEPEDDQGKRKRKKVFEASSPSKQAQSLPECSPPSPLRAQSPARSNNTGSSKPEATVPGARSSSTAELVPPINATPISLCTENHSNSLLLMLNYNILAETDPDQAKILTEVACAMALLEKEKEEQMKVEESLRLQLALLEQKKVEMEETLERVKEEKEELEEGLRLQQVLLEQEEEHAKEKDSLKLLLKEQRKAVEDSLRSHEKEISLCHKVMDTLQRENEEKLKLTSSLRFHLTVLGQDKEEQANEKDVLKLQLQEQRKAAEDYLRSHGMERSVRLQMVERLETEKDELLKVEESLRLQLALLEQQKEELAKEKDVLKFQLKEKVKAMEDSLRSHEEERSLRLQEVETLEREKEEQLKAEESLCFQLALLKQEKEQQAKEKDALELRLKEQVKAVEDSLRSHEEERSLRLQMEEILETKKEEQLKVEESLRLQLVLLEQEKEEQAKEKDALKPLLKVQVKAMEDPLEKERSLCLQVENLEREKKHKQGLMQSFRVRLAFLEQEKEERLKEKDSLKLQTARATECGGVVECPGGYVAGAREGERVLAAGAAGANEDG